nr:hypothetical protein [Tanacetum cinerariifolium]
MSSFYEFICYGCGGPSDTPLCYLCTCEHYGNILINGTCSKCNSGAGNSFAYDPIPKSFNEIQSISNPPPQSHFKIYLCQICKSNSHYGYECSQRVLLVYEPEPCYNQNFGDNAYPHDLPGVTPLIDHHCCYKYGDSLDDFFCHKCTCEFCGNTAHDGYNFPSYVPFIQTLPSFPQQYPCCKDSCDEFTTFSNLLFDADDDFSSSDNESFCDEDSLKEIYSNHLFDEEIISIKIDPHHFNAESDLIESLLNLISLIISFSSIIDCLLDEFAGELILLKSIPPEFISENSDAEIECFSPSPIPVEDNDSLMEKNDLTLTLDDSMPPGIENDDYDSEVDILILEEFLSNNSFYFLKMSHFILIFHHSLAFLRNHQMMMKLNPTRES